MNDGATLWGVIRGPIELPHGQGWVVVSQEGVDRMSEVQRDESLGVLEREWRRAVVEVERARQKYLRCLEATDAGESRFRQAWLHLYRAERRRDELLMSLE